MRVPVKLGEQVVNLPALEALIRVHGAKAMHGDRKSQRAMSVIMEKLGFFDEKGDSENKGVMILRNSERLTEDEWVWLYGDSPRGFCQAYPEYATLARNA